MPARIHYLVGVAAAAGGYAYREEVADALGLASLARLQQRVASCEGIDDYAEYTQSNIVTGAPFFFSK